jgi:hypothetical protein
VPREGVATSRSASCRNPSGVVEEELLAGDSERVSPFSPAITCSPNSETTPVDDNDDDIVVVDPMVEERLQGSTRVRRAENTRLISVGASVSVSAEESGELSGVTGADAGRTNTAPDWTVRLLQHGNGMEQLRGDDGADTGAGGSTLVTVACSSNEIWRRGSGLGTSSAFSWIPISRSGSCSCAGNVRRRSFVVISGGGLRTEGTSHVNESTAILYS